MLIPPISSVPTQIPVPLKKRPCCLLALCQEKFGPFFASLKQQLQKVCKIKTASASPPTTAPIGKVENAATQLRPSATDKTEKISLDEVIPFDPKTTLKTLPNGFTYYIRKHDYPSTKTASLRLVVNAGSSDEKEEERGIAHLIEHLVYVHDTESFAKIQIREYLESVGVMAIVDQNAFTTYNKTVYQIDIPLQNPEVLEKAIFILSEWATKSKLLDKSVEEERSIVLDEIVNESSVSRSNKKKIEMLFEGTPYPERDPGGLVKVIKECTPDQVRQFYKRWYQPNNMALVAVGDFDPQQVEKFIKAYFSPISSSPYPAATHDFLPVEHKETRFLFHIDPEISATEFNLFFPIETGKIHSGSTMAGVRQEIIDAFFHAMFNARLRELMCERDDPPYTDISGDKVEYFPNLFHYVLAVTANNGELQKAFKQSILEIRRLQQYGFLPEEFEETKANYLSALKNLEKEKELKSTAALAQNYVDHFSEKSPAYDIEASLKIRRKLLDQISLQDVNEWIHLLTNQSAPLITVTAPESPHLVPPTQEQLEGILREVELDELVPYQHAALDKPLLRSSPTPGKIVATQLHEKVGVTEWRLENGMRVFCKPTQLKDNIILSCLSAIGGELASDPKDRPSVEMAQYIIGNSGLGNYSKKQLSKYFKKNHMKLGMAMENYTSSYVAKAPKTEIEKMFQMLHACLADPGYDKKGFEAKKKEVINDLKFRHHDPDLLYHETHVALSTQNHPSFICLEPEQIEQVDYETALAFLQSRFSNPTNFDLVIVGNITPEEIQPLIENYMAGIPKKGERERTFNLPGYEYPPGIAKKELGGEKNSSSKCHLSFPSPIPDDRRLRNYGVWTASLVTRQLKKKFRFEQGKTYTINCQFSITSVPGQNKTDPCSMEIGFTSLPEIMNGFTEKVVQELGRMQAEGFTDEDLAILKAEVKEAFRTSLDHDTVWLSFLIFAARWDRDINTLVDDYYSDLDAFTLQDAQEMMRNLFPLNRYTQVVMHPKQPQAAAAAAA